MIHLTVFIAGILPAIFLVVFIYWKDKYQREPWKWIGKAFYYGIISAIPVVIIELILPKMPNTDYGTSAYNAFIGAAVPEECMKMLFFWLLIRKNPFFDERMDGIVYACCVSMGFAGLENIMYMFGNLDSLASVAIIRATLSVPGHFFFAVFMGFYYSLAIFGNQEHRTRNMILALLVPIVLHGAFDFGLMSMQISTDTAIFSFIFFIAVCRYCWKYGRRRINAVLEMEKPVADGNDETL